MYNFPPTPTPLPPAGPAPVTLPNDFGMWSSSGEVINMWNFFGQYTPVVQIMVIAAIIFAAAFIIMRVVNSLNNEDNNDSNKIQNIRVTVRQPQRRRRR